MIDIYDEVGYVKEILEHGLSDRWERDAMLLARYYKSQEVKKSEAKVLIKEKAERYVRNYKKYKDFPRANKIVDLAYKKTVPLREIREVRFSKEVLDWFLGLERNVVISGEVQEKLRSERKGLKVTNHPINFNRTKFLFTLFIWTKIQENYLEKPHMHYLADYMKRFKHDADLPASFSVNKEKNLLHDLGFIYINFAQGIDCIFIRMNPNVFKKESKEEIVISGIDLYNPGYWLQKQKYGSFICQNCGNEFAHYNDTKQEKNRKYCKECADLLKNHKVENGVRIIKCCDCGIEVEISAKDHQTKRCYDCQNAYKQEQNRQLKAKQRKQSEENREIIQEETKMSPAQSDS